MSLRTELERFLSEPRIIKREYVPRISCKHDWKFASHGEDVVHEKCRSCGAECTRDKKDKIVEYTLIPGLMIPETDLNETFP